MYHDAFNPDADEVNDLKERYVVGKVGDVEVKQKLTIALNNLLDPFRERRSYYEAHLDEVRDALESGTARARVAAQETMALVRDAMAINYLNGPPGGR